MTSLDLQPGDVVTLGSSPTRWLVERHVRRDGGVEGLKLRPIDVATECLTCGHPLERHSWFGCMVNGETRHGCACHQQTTVVDGRKVWASCAR